MNTEIALVENEVFHVSAVKAFHQEVRAAETSAAIAAWHAGNHARKLQEQFGWSERKIVEATGLPKTTVHRYLLVVRRRTSPTDIRFGESISSIIEEDVPSVREKKARAATFSNAEAEYAMKLVRMAESNSEHEAAIASRKLDQFAADHGMSKDELVSKSRKVLDLDWVEEKQQMHTVQAAMTRVIERKFSLKSKPDLIKIIVQMVLNHPEILGTLKDYLNR